MSDDSSEFRDALKDVRPLKQHKVAPAGPRPRPIPVQTHRENARVVADLLHHPIDPARVETGEELLYTSAGVQRNVLRRLRRGGYTVTAQIDLHGMRINEAAVALDQFFKGVRRNNLSCVRVIHGKGKRSPGREPVLKNWIAQWLRLRKDVLAYATAPAHDGGGGAVYVLLKRA